MARYRTFYTLIHFLAFYCHGTTSKSVDLSTDPPFPIERGEKVIFQCTVTGNPGLVGYWDSFRPEQAMVSWKIDENGCNLFQAPDGTNYNISASCDNENFIMEIENIPEILHNYSMECKVYFDQNTDAITKTVQVNINIPLTSVELMEPPDVTVKENEILDISCDARSRPLPEITWYISGEPIKNNQTSSENDTVVTSTLHYIGNRTHNNNSIYCVAKRGNTIVESDRVFLNITYPPDLAIVMETLPIEGTPSFNMSCSVVDSNPSPVNFSWKIGQYKTPESYSKVLTLDNLHRNDSNNYTCSSSNGIGNGSINILYLDVLYKGSILNFKSTNLSVNEGQLVTVHVELEGKPLPNVTWSYNRTGVILLQENGVTKSSINNTASCEDTGNYTISADNGLVEANNYIYRLEAYCGPRFDFNSTNDITVEIGKSLDLHTSFIAYPRPNITWYFKGDNSKVNSTIVMSSYMVIIKRSDEAVHTSTLSVSEANMSHSGQYFVAVENAMGIGMMLISVIVIDPNSETSVAVETIVASVLGAVVFLILAACVVNCYRKKKRKEKKRQMSWRTSPKDIDDIIKENPIEDVEEIEPAYVTTNPYYSQKQRPVSTMFESEINSKHVYGKVVKPSPKQVIGATEDQNTKL